MSSRRKPFVLANWKMSLSLAESVTLAKAVVRQFSALKLKDHLELALAPTYPALPAVGEAVKRTGVSLGAQDVFWKAAGPYTGEVSPAVLQELGVRYVIIGHSERRQYLKETDAMIQQKLLSSLAHGLVPVLCVGETYAERQAGQTNSVVARQVTAALQGVTLSPEAEVVIAYEPVWVIGSGQAVAPDEAAATAKTISQSLKPLLPPSLVSRQVRIIYGGSVDPSNIRAFVSDGPLQGVLVGGASLKARRFIALLKQL